MDWPTTSWTAVREAGAGPQAAQALDQLVRIYAKPVYTFLGFLRRAYGYSARRDDLEDDFQGFLLFIIQEETLKRCKQEGKFRNFLKACARNFWRARRRDERALKRGGGADHVPLDEQGLADSEEDLIYERAWARALFDDAYAELRAWLETRAPRRLEVLERTILRGESLKECAKNMEIPDWAVRNDKADNKKLLTKLIDARLRDQCSDSESLADERRLFWSLMGAKRP